jgi:hypothetical protein
MASPRIKIQGKTYKVPSMEDLSIDDILVLDAELQDRYRSSWVAVQRFVKDMDALPEDEQEAAAEDHPMGTLMGGVTVWMVLRVAGKASITMQEALSIPMDSVEDVVMEAPKDHQPKKKRPPRKSSAPAAVSRLHEGESETSSLPTTSSEQSASA